MENKYSTTNFQIAVWLMVNDVQLVDVKWTGRRADFTFIDFEGRENLVNDFFENQEIQKWISSTQELKARMYAEQSPTEYRR
jgi:hypothetical protein